MPEEFLEKLRTIFLGRVVYLGMGNILRGDDGLGPELLARLGKRGALVVDAGTAPENHIGSVVRLEPDTVVIIDAVHLERETGDVELLRRGEILEHTGFTTHNLSPALVMERLEAETGADIVMLAVQPGTTEFGSPLSGPVVRLLDELAAVLPVREES